MKVWWTRRAEADLDAAILHVAEDDPAAAERLLDAILEGIDLLCDGRFDGPETPLAGEVGVRSWLVRPFRLYYRRAPDTLVLLRVYHERRKQLP